MPLRLSRSHSLGPCLAPLRSVHGAPMRLKMDVLKTVFYVGTKEPGSDFHALGTAFLIGLPSATGYMGYLVTARHVAEHFGDDPFYLRLNRKDGATQDFYVDMLAAEARDKIKWFFHPSASVDIAVMPFFVDLERVGIDFLVISSAEMVDRFKPAEASPVGCGDLCYAVGLFSVAPGQKQNFPVVHTGHIARMSNRNELIPQWVNGRTVEREGYLVQLSNLGGLSGAPVFVRSGYSIEFENGDSGVVPRERVELMGVWSGSWETPKPDNPQMRVPVGMGIVSPSERLMELLNSDALQEFVAAGIAQATASTPDDAPAA